MTATREVLGRMLARRLAPEQATWLEQRERDVEQGVGDDCFARLVSLASRHAPRTALTPDGDERAQAGKALAGWNPERWTVLEGVRLALVLARRDLAGPGAVRALGEAFRYADEGELCALYKALAHLPDGERFAWRAGEGCRTNMLRVFESVACDSPFPARHFDAPTFEQMCIKAVFVGAPLWRVHGLDRRLTPELARMALDLADERRSAGRPVQHELWLCLGPHGGERARAALEREVAASPTLERRAACLALARAGAAERLRELAEGDADAAVRATARAALEDPAAAGQEAFRELDPRSV